MGGSAARRAQPFYDIQVTPGDISVRRNSDSSVTAQLIGLQTRERAPVCALSERFEMGPGAHATAGGRLRASNSFLRACRKSVEYYVEAGRSTRSHFNIRVLDLPSVKKIRVTYRYPAWTACKTCRGARRRSPRRRRHRSRISKSQPTGRCATASWCSTTSSRLHFRGGEGNVYKGTIPMEKDGVYHVAALDQGQPVRLSNDFFIEARKAEAAERDHRASRPRLPRQPHRGSHRRGEGRR